MAKCFITKFLGEIDNDNLPLYDTFVIHVTPNVANAGNFDARIINFQSPKDIVISTKDGGNHIAYVQREWANTEPTNITNKVTVPANTKAGVYMKDDVAYDVLVSGLYSFTYIGSTNGGSSSRGFSFDINQLSNSTNLQTLNIAKGTQVTGDISNLKGLINLQTLNLYYARQISGDIANLKGLTNLQTLNLNYAAQVSGDIANLKGLTNLQTLSLSGATQVSGDIKNLSTLVNLTELSVYTTKVFGNILSLSKMTNLTKLEIGGTAITGDIKTFADEIAKNNVEHTLKVGVESGGNINTNATYDGKACAQRIYTFSFKTDGTYTVN